MLKEYRLRSALTEVSGLTAQMLKQLEPLALSEDDIFGLRLSLEEAFINAVRHGNKNDPAKKILVKIDASPEGVEIEIKDEGQGFDYLNLPSPIEKENLEKPCQRGIFLIQQMMDRVEFLDGGSRIKMLKLLHRGKGA